MGTAVFKSGHRFKVQAGQRGLKGTAQVMNAAKRPSALLVVIKEKGYKARGGRLVL